MGNLLLVTSSLFGENSKSREVALDLVQRLQSSDPTLHVRTRDTLMVVLTLLTGVTDATTFLKLGNVFTSVMTGNMVLMGLSIGRADLDAFGHAALAVVSYIVGTIAG